MSTPEKVTELLKEIDTKIKDLYDIVEAEGKMNLEMFGLFEMFDLFEITFQDLWCNIAQSFDDEDEEEDEE